MGLSERLTVSPDFTFWSPDVGGLKSPVFSTPLRTCSTFMPRYRSTTGVSALSSRYCVTSRNALRRDSVDLGTDSGVLFFEPLRRLLIPFVAADIRDARIEQMPLDYSGGDIAATAFRPAAKSTSRMEVWIEVNHRLFPSARALLADLLLQGDRRAACIAALALRVRFDRNVLIRRGGRRRPSRRLTRG